MPRGDKSAYTGKQKRQAERRAWATVNKETGGGKKGKSAGKKTASRRGSKPHSGRSRRSSKKQ